MSRPEAKSRIIEVPLWDEAELRAHPSAYDERTENGPEGPKDRRIFHVRTPSFVAYLPSLGFPAPAVLIVPGGGYEKVTFDKEGREIAEWLNTRGYAAFVLRYRMPQRAESEHDPALPLRDTERAWELIHDKADEWGVHPGRIGVLGFSSGGHLSAMLGTQPPEALRSRPAYLILVYAYLDTVRDGSDAIVRTNRRLFGSNSDDTRVHAFNPITRVHSEMPPTLLVHGRQDTKVPVRQVIRFHEACLDHGVPAELHLYDAEHGFGLRVDRGLVRHWLARALSWTRKVEAPRLK